MSRSTARSARSRLRMIAAISAAVFAAATGFAAPAQADEFGQASATSGAIPDNWDHNYCFTGFGFDTAWQNIVHAQMQNLDNQTTFFDSYHAVCQPGTDIRFVLDNFIGVRGSYTCTGWNNGNDGWPGTGDEECEKAVIRLNPSVLPDAHQRRKTTCHEIGHSVGLAHGNSTTTFWNDCMLSGTAPVGLQFEQYNQHHINHANSQTKTTS